MKIHRKNSREQKKIAAGRIEETIKIVVELNKIVETMLTEDEPHNKDNPARIKPDAISNGEDSNKPIDSETKIAVVRNQTAEAIAVRWKTDVLSKIVVPSSRDVLSKIVRLIEIVEIAESREGVLKPIKEDVQRTDAERIIVVEMKIADGQKTAGVKKEGVRKEIAVTEATSEDVRKIAVVKRIVAERIIAELKIVVMKMIDGDATVTDVTNSMIGTNKDVFRESV